MKSSAQKIPVVPDMSPGTSAPSLVNTVPARGVGGHPVLEGGAGWANLATEARGLLVTMRPSQWPKNAFLFAPLFFSRRFMDAGLLLDVVLGFVVFCLGSSAVYLFNDLLDAERDRRHPRKRNRPIAAGKLSPATASWAVALLAATTLIASYFLGPVFLLIVSAYLALNLFYTLRLKHVVILDVMCIAVGFLLRVLGGSVLAGVHPSHWLILCTLTLATFLGFSKRRQELIVAGENPSENRAVLQSYSIGFLDQMIAVATSCAVISYALYTVADDTVARFGTTNLIYTFPFVLFGIFRYFHLTYHQNAEDNPSLLVLSDKALVVNGLIYAVVCGAVIY